jgi:hypothetical protein
MVTAHARRATAGNAGLAHPRQPSIHADRPRAELIPRRGRGWQPAPWARPPNADRSLQNGRTQAILPGLRRHLRRARGRRRNGSSHKAPGHR